MYSPPPPPPPLAALYSNAGYYENESHYADLKRVWYTRILLYTLLC